MFETLSERLGSIFEGLRGRGALEEKDVSAALREVRIALLEADVALPVAKDFVAKVKERAIGQDVLRSVTPGQQVIKIVHDALIEMLGGMPGENTNADDGTLNLAMAPPAPILMVGLQGSGKTTTTAKIALRLSKRDKKKVLMASLDTRRPAAMEQLQTLGEQTDVATLPIIAGQTPVQIAKRAMEAAKLSGADVVMLDTAGRLSIDEQLMAEVAEIHAATNPIETLLVLDSLTGQDAVQTAEKFKERLPITGVVLTRLDGDGRGGAALSMRAVTGAPIKFAGVGEKIDALDTFDPERMAGRILGMGDIVSLVEKAAEEMDVEKAKRQAKKMAKGEFDMNDLADQFKQMRKMGGMGAILGLMPGMGKMKKMVDQAGGLDDKEIVRQEAIISSMTKKERKSPKLLNASRKKRIAAGSGTSVQEINRLIKAHRQMADMMKKMGKGGMKSMAQQLAAMGGMPGGGGMPAGAGMGGGIPDPTALEDPGGSGNAMGKDDIDFDAINQALSGKGALPPGLGGLGGGLPGGMGGLPGMGGKPKRKKR
ncbi:MAG: signal recognition particle protein [Pseudomonadota bacterium]